MQFFLAKLRSRLGTGRVFFSERVVKEVCFWSCAPEAEAAAAGGGEGEGEDVVGEVFERALRSVEEEAVSLFLREKRPSLRIFPEVEGDGSFVDVELVLEELTFPTPGGGTEAEREEGGAAEEEDADGAVDRDERGEVRGAKEGPEVALAGELMAESVKKFLFLVFVGRLVGAPSPLPEPAATRLPG